MTLNRRILKRVRSPLKSPKLHNTSLRKRALMKQLSGDVRFGAASKANVKVVVRIRPQNSRELESSQRSIIKVVDDHMMIFDPKEEQDEFFFKGIRQRSRDLSRRQPKEQKFIFERIYDVNSTNEQIYEETTKDIIDTVLEGYNCSVFAYGATGAGKTHTMLGKPDFPGIIFLTLMELYRCIEEVKEEKTCEVGVSYLEVYNETVRDLLKPGKHLNIQESGTRVLVPGLSFHKPKDAEDLLKMLAYGNQNRSQHPTDANAESSRSHAVFQIFVKQQDRTANLTANVCVAKLSMIDLAGSERGTATSYKGARFREGANINKSLLALGNCINALADGLRHVPYRDSKLTRLLKDSLGGNCRSVMIAAVSPAASSFEDTFNTLRYANRAKTIKTTLKKNLMNVDQHVSQYVKIVEDLREEICCLKEKVKNYEEKDGDLEANKAELQLANEALAKQTELESEIAGLEQQLQEKTRAVAKAQSSAYTVSEEERSSQKCLEEASSESKSLRRELLQLESSQRELEIKMHNTTLRLQRMKIVSFASQRLDKSISKCERTIRNFTNRLDQTKRLQQNVELKLEANLNKLHAIQMDLNQWGLAAGQPSEPSKNLIEKNEASLAERDLGQLAEYLRGLVKEGIIEQRSSEQLTCQLLSVLRKFYVQLRANNVCSPEMERLFEGIIDNMNESKIIWADQHKDQEQHDPYRDVVPQPVLDVDRITSLPIISKVFISPAIPQENKKVFRQSIMKGSKSASCLQHVTMTTEHTWHESENPVLSKIHESNGMETSPEEITTPESPVLSAFSSVDVDYGIRPSPVIGNGHLPARTEAQVTTVQSPYDGAGTNSYSPLGEITSLRPNRLLPVITTITEESLNETEVIDANVPSATVSDSYMQPSPVLSQSSIAQNGHKNLSFGFVSMTKDENEPVVSLENDCNVTSKLNATELLEDIQFVDCSINSTFAITPAKGLNVTMDMPCSVKSLNTTIDLPNKTPVHPSYVSNLSTTKAFKTDDFGILSSIGSAIKEVSAPKTLNTTIDLSDRTCEGSKVHVRVDPPSSRVVSDVQEKSSSRSLFQSGSLDATFSLENSLLGCSTLDQKSPDMLPKPVTNGMKMQRSPLAPLENICATNKTSKELVGIPVIITPDENPMPPPSTTKKGILKKPGLSTYKITTPIKTKGFLSTSKTTSVGGMRRSVSTSSLHSRPLSSLKQDPASPVFKRKYNAFGGALRKTTSFLKPNKHKNQENLPPGSHASYTPNYKSLAQRETASSMAKQVSHSLQKT